MRARTLFAGLLCFGWASGCTSSTSSGDKVDPGITVSPVSGATNEGGSQATFTVLLDAKPSADVTIAVNSSDVSEGTVGPASLTFTALNFGAPQMVTITGVGDDQADGPVTFDVSLVVSSDDDRYSAKAVPSVPVVNVDDDTAGVTVSPVSGATTEIGGTASFWVALNSEPTGDVTVAFDTSNASEGDVAVPSLSFTTANWKAPQEVVVTGVDDSVADGSQNYAVVFAGITSSDTRYAAVTIPSVAITNIDNDTAGVTVTPVTGATSEAGGSATFAVLLNSQPTANVTVNFVSNNPSEGTTGVTSLLFTPLNFSTPQWVTITGANDAVADGNQLYSVVFFPTTSADAQYAAITPTNFALTNIDNDTAGFLVTPVTNPVEESFATATFSIALTSQPMADVTVNFAISDATEAWLSANSRTFSPLNYSVPQTVTITGVDDSLVDGNQPFQVTFFATSSADPKYGVIRPLNLPVTNVDDDQRLLFGTVPELPDTGSFTANFLLGRQITVTKTSVLQAFGVVAKAAGPNVKFGLYRDVAGNPSTLVAQSAPVSVVDGYREATVTANVVLQPGSYWMMAVYDGAAGVAQRLSDTVAYKYVAHPYANALPAAFPAPTNDSGGSFNYYLVTSTSPRIGNTVELPLTASFGVDILLGEQIVVSDTVQLRKLGIIAKATLGSVKAGLYTDVAGSPATLVAAVPSTLVTAGAFEIPVGPGIYLNPGTYWFMAVYNTSNGAAFDDNGLSTSVVKYAIVPFGSALPTTFPAATTYTGQDFNYYVVTTPY